MSEPVHRPIVDFCRRLLAEHGDTPTGMGWTPGDAEVRYRVMLDVVRSGSGPVTLLDFGCGAGHLLEHLRRNGRQDVEYHGLDVAPAAIELCRRKFPGTTFLELDVLAPGAPPLPRFDYVVLNGIFTYKGEIAHEAMLDYCRRLVRTVFAAADVGIAFNVMSKQVDWERDDLFHLPLDPLLDFLARELSRHVVVRQDYGLYEYTVYVYRDICPGGLEGNRPRIESGGSEEPA